MTIQLIYLLLLTFCFVVFVSYLCTDIMRVGSILGIIYHSTMHHCVVLCFSVSMGRLLKNRIYDVMHKSVVGSLMAFTAVSSMYLIYRGVQWMTGITMSLSNNDSE